MKAHNWEIRLSESMPSGKKIRIPWNKDKKTGLAYERTPEQLLMQRIGRLLLIGLGWKNEGKKAGRKPGSIPWNKGRKTV
jgi:hypothetical protein